MRDPLEYKDKFYYGKESDENQYIIYWENGRLYAVHPSYQTELCYAHFFRRKFKIYSLNESIQSIKVVPSYIIYNEKINETDFQFREEKGYYRKSKFAVIRNNLRRYGVYKMIRRRFWSQKSNRYIEKI